MRWARHVARMGDRRSAFRDLMGRPERKSHVVDLDVDGRKMLKFIFKKLGGVMDWIELAQDRDRWTAPVNAVMDFWVP